MVLYIIGCFLSATLSIIMLLKEKDKTKLQCGMIIPVTLLSWISTIFIIWKYGKELKEYYLIR